MKQIAEIDSAMVREGPRMAFAPHFDAVARHDSIETIAPCFHGLKGRLEQPQSGSRLGRRRYRSREGHLRDLFFQLGRLELYPATHQ